LGRESENVVYISYEEAQRLIPFFEYAAKHGPWKEAREEAKSLLRELRMVRNIEYSLGGEQIFVTQAQHDFLRDTMDSLGMK